jgi:lipopolysaccharide transport system permease protein
MVDQVRFATQTLSSAGNGAVKLLRYRDLLWQMIRSDVRGRYLGSLLGSLWAIIHPLVLIGIYMLVFSRLMGARLGARSDSPYSFGIYLCAALLPWMLFAEVIGRNAGILIERANLVKKMAFPNLLLHFYVAGTALVNAGLMIILFLLALVFAGQMPPLSYLAVWLLLVLLQLGLAMGIGLLASTLNVFFRDVGQVMAMLLQIWFWLTPIVYVADILPPAARGMLRFNIIAWYASAQQQAILGESIPGATTLVALVLLPVVVMTAGVALYSALRHQIPDEL